MARPGAPSLAAWLRLVRIPFAPTAAWDAVACLVLALTAAGWGVERVALLHWALLALTSLLLYAFGMASNDLFDRPRDAVLAPDRPLPSGAISPGAAKVAILLFAAGATALGGSPAGSRLSVLGVLLFATVYNRYAKRHAVAGAVTMGLVRFANGSIGVLPLVQEGVAPAYVLLGPAAVGLYSAAITVLSTTEEAPAPRRVIAMRVLVALAFLLALALPWYVTGRPTLALLVGGGVCTSVVFGRTPRPGPPKRQVLEMMLAFYFLSACLATAADGGSLTASLVPFAVAFAAIFLTQLAVRALRRAAARGS